MIVIKQVGICGEHGGEPSSIAFFAEAGLDYVSCSPFRLVCLGTLKYPMLLSSLEQNPDLNFIDRVPIARLAAAQVVV